MNPQAFKSVLIGKFGADVGVEDDGIDTALVSLGPLFTFKIALREE